MCDDHETRGVGVSVVSGAVDGIGVGAVVKAIGALVGMNAGAALGLEVGTTGCAPLHAQHMSYEVKSSSLHLLHQLGKDA